MIFERRGTSEMSPLAALAYYLENISRPHYRRGQLEQNLGFSLKWGDGVESPGKPRRLELQGSALERRALQGRSELHGERALGLCGGLPGNISWVPISCGYEARKEPPPERNKQNNLDAHKGLGMVSVPTKVEKPYHTQGPGKSSQKDIASRVGQN